MRKGQKHTKISIDRIKKGHIGQKGFWKDKTLSSTHIEAMSNAHKKRGTRPPSQKGKMPWNFKGDKEEWEKYRIIMLSKPNQCEVCGSIQEGNKNKICWDHDHVTDKFRGWICFRCNFALGLMKDNVELIEALAIYLKKSKDL